MNGHSPLPWSYAQYAGTCGIDDADGSSVADAVEPADADLILRGIAALAEVGRLRALLAEAEWRGVVGGSFGSDLAPACPWCGASLNDGHAPDCRLAAALTTAPSGTSSPPPES